MDTSGTNRRVRKLMTALRNGELVPRPEFQRRLVWTNRHKEKFLETVLMEYPFPEIYIASSNVDPDTGEGIEMLVDGQQRITTLFQYFSGSKDLQLKKLPSYAELAKEEKVKFLDYEVVVRDLGTKSIGEIREVFERINSTQYALNAMEIRNARYDGELKKCVEELSQNSFFIENSVFRITDIRRMRDVSFSLSLIISILGGYSNREDRFDEFLSKYNDEFPQSEEILANLDAVFDIINKCKFDPKHRVWGKTDLFTLIVELYKAKFRDSIKIKIAKLEDSLKGFYKIVGDSEDEEDVNKKSYIYYKATVQASNDRLNRVRRGEILSEIIANC